MKLYATLGALGLILGSLFFFPAWNVYRASKSGEAALMRAEQEKRILIEQARAEVEAAQLRAEAIAIVGQAAKEFPEYRVQEFIAAFGEALQSESIEKVIFVPTEAQIPLVVPR